MLQNGDDERRQLEPRARRRHDGTLEEAQEAIDALSARLKRPTAKLQPPPTFVGPCTLWFSKCKLSESNNRKLLAKTAEELQAASTVPGGYFAPTGKAHSVAFAGFVNEEDLYLPAHQGPEENAPICTVNGCEAELVDPHETSDLDTYEGAKCARARRPPPRACTRSLSCVLPSGCAQLACTPPAFAWQRLAAPSALLLSPSSARIPSAAIAGTASSWNGSGWESTSQARCCSAQASSTSTHSMTAGPVPIPVHMPS
jgi:hypothetical protein